MNIRKLQLVKDESDKSVTVNKWVNLGIDEALPILVVNKELIDDNLLTSIDNDKQEDADVKNTLNDDYIFVNEATTIYSNSKYRIYYDKNTKELLIMPTFKYMGSNEDGDPYLRHTMDIKGYNIGVNKKVNSRVLMGATTNLDNLDPFEMPEPNGNISTRTVLVRLEGINYNSKNKEYLEIGKSVDDGTTITYSDPSMSSNTLLELGKASDIFKDSDVKFPIYGLVPSDLGINAIKFLGYGFPSDNEYVYIGLKA